MRKFYTTLSALCIAWASLSAQPVAPVCLKGAECGQAASVIASQSISKNNGRLAARKAAKHHAFSADDNVSAKRAVVGPSDNQPYISERPAGTSQIYSKTCIGYGYNWIMGRWVDEVEAGVSEIVTAPDGKTVYLYAPFSYYPTQGWIEGTVEGNVMTFNLPQIVNQEEFFGMIYEDYAVCLKMYDEESQLFNAVEDQAFTFIAGDDGVLRSADPSVMIGFCAWDGKNWAWQACGDVDITLTPIKDKIVEAPADADFEKWWMVDGIYANPVSVAVSGSKIYFKGLFADMPDAAVEGDFDGSKVTVKSGQFLGAYWDNLSPAYFISVKGTLQAGEMFYELCDDIVFDYDAQAKTVKSTGTYAISAFKDRVLYYKVVSNPEVKYQSIENVNVTSLLAPVYGIYYPEEPEYGYEAELQFMLPQVDADGQVLDTSKIYWNLIMDDEVFVFMPDEYMDIWEDMVNVPYGFNSDHEFFSEGCVSGLLIYPWGYDNLGVRSLYIDGDKTVQSDIMWVPGFESALKDVTIGSTEIKSIRYFDLQGRQIENPSAGLYIRSVTFADGRVKTSKIVKR